MLKMMFEKLFPLQAERIKAGRSFKEHLQTGEYELSILSSLVISGKTSLDVGGNVGDYAFGLSSLVPKVITFEPNPGYAGRLRRLNIPNVTVEEVVISDKEGEAVLRIPQVHGRVDEGMGSVEQSAVPDEHLVRSIRVRTRTIDSFDFANIGFIKIDVEGHEEAVLKGAIKTIERNRPNLLIEIEDRHNPGGVDRIKAELGRIDYQGWFFQDGKMVPIVNFSPEKHQVVTESLQHARFNRRDLSSYINNFFFRARDE